MKGDDEMPKPVKDLTDFERAIIVEIDHLLKEKKLSRYGLSKRTMITQASLSTILKGQISPTMLTLYRIFKGLDIEPGDFFQECFGKQSKVLTGDEKLLLAKWEMLNDGSKKLALGYISDLVNYKECL